MTPSNPSNIIDGGCRIIGGTDNRRLIACYNITTSHNGGIFTANFLDEDQGRMVLMMMIIDENQIYIYMKQKRKKT